MDLEPEVRESTWSQTATCADAHAWKRSSFETATCADAHTWKRSSFGACCICMPALTLVHDALYMTAIYTAVPANIAVTLRRQAMGIRTPVLCAQAQLCATCREKSANIALLCQGKPIEARLQMTEAHPCFPSEPPVVSFRRWCNHLRDVLNCERLTMGDLAAECMTRPAIDH